MIVLVRDVWHRKVVVLLLFDVLFIRCCTGKNALDFQLSTELGYQISRVPDKRFAIVSNDAGYDSIISYWKGRGRIVERISLKVFLSELSGDNLSDGVAVADKKPTSTANEVDSTALEVFSI